jgi:hypothetical protein
MLLQDGQYKGVKILSSEAIATLRRIHVPAASLKHNIKMMANTDWALGAWAPEATGEKADALLIPSYAGTALAIDFCRNYAAAYLLKDPNESGKGEAINDLRAIIDERFPKNCK